MPRILLVNQYYWPDFASTGQHLTDLAEHLVDCGHEVRVLCSRGRYMRGRGEAPLRETRRGVEIHRVRASSHGKGRALGRVLDYLSFHLLAGPKAAFSRWPDVVVTLTTPPLLPFWGALGSRKRRKHINFVMDLHPDAEFELGILSRRSPHGRLLEAIHAWSLRRAHMNVVLGPYQGQRVLDKGVKPESMREIPVWSDGDEIEPLDHRLNDLRTRLGWKGKFVAMYSGNAGLVHSFDEMLEAARILKERDPDVCFAFIGGGPRRAEIVAAVEEHQLDNVELLPYFDRSELCRSLGSADLHLISLRPEHVGVAVPGKLYGCLAAGRPVIFVGPEESDTARDLLAAGAGSVVPLGGGEALATKILELKGDPALGIEQGASGRAAFESSFARKVACSAWAKLIEEMLGLDVLLEAGQGSEADAKTTGERLEVPGAALPSVKAERVPRA